MVIGKDKTKKQVTDSGEKKSTPVTNPVNIVAHINSITQKNTANKLYGGYNKFLSKNKYVVDYVDFIQKLSSIVAKGESYYNFYSEIHQLLINNLNVAFTGIGIFNEKSKCIHLKVTSKTGTTYSSRIFEKDSYNNEIWRNFY